MSNETYKMPGGFNFNALVRRIYKEAKSADPKVFAAQVFREIPSSCYGGVLQIVLIRYCNWYSSVQRMTTRGTIAGATKPSKTKLSKQASPITPQQQEAINRKYDGLQEAWLKLRVATEKGTKFLGDCGVADLDYVILELEENAAECEASAQQYKKLRSALVKYEVERVKDLPTEVRQSFTRMGVT